MIEAVRRIGASARARRMHRIEAGPAAGLRISRAGASADYVRGTNELPVQVALTEVLTAGDVLLDVGANVGFFSLLGARLVGPQGSVYAVEPVPANAARLRANAERNGLTNVEVLELALTEAAGTARLLLAAHPGGAAVASAGTPPDAAGSIDVPCETVDGLIAAGRIRPPTVVKIDVEGAEAAVLAGMATTLRDVRPTVLCEIDSDDRTRLASKRADVLALLEHASYDVEQLGAAYDGSEWLVEHLLATPRDEPS